MLSTTHNVYTHKAIVRAQLQVHAQVRFSNILFPHLTMRELIWLLDLRALKSLLSLMLFLSFPVLDRVVIMQQDLSSRASSSATVYRPQTGGTGRSSGRRFNGELIRKAKLV